MILRLIVFQIVILVGLIYPQTKDSVYIDTTKTGLIDTVATDTTGLFSTKKELAKVDSLIPLYQNPFYSRSEFIDRKQIDFLDYRYTGDLFSPFGMSFLRNYGFVGHPNELMLYGTSDISYFENGILANSRTSGYFNLNLLQPEMIDSIEIVQSPRGFLFGPASNPVSVNFLKRDIFSKKPYTRIKYYEGANGEAFINAIFNFIVVKDFLFTFGISNRKADISYINSDFSIWQGEAHLKYLLSDNINLTANYSYNDYNAGLNGGVNVDSISQFTTSINTILYDEQQAPVYFNQRRTNILQHNVGLRLFANPVSNSQTDLSIYYHFNKDEVSNPPDFLSYPAKDKNKTTGALLRQNITLSFADLKILAQYEKTNSNFYVPNSNLDYNQSYFTLAPVFSLNLIDSTIVPSVYYKFQNITNGDSKSYNGLGFDLSLNPLDYLKLYGGYSNYKSINLSDNVNTIEISAKLNYENLNFGLDFINRSQSFLYVDPSPFTADEEYYLDLSATQIGGSVSLKLWKILLEASSFYDLSKHNSFGNSPVVSVAAPKIKATGGIYFDGLFFKDNLNLKTGFAFNYNSKQRIFISGREQDLTNQFVTIDFTLAGEIQKVAIAYFTWENLLDNTYYIVPYYPMFRRGIRFGVGWELFN